MNVIAKDIAIVVVFVITGWMLKTWLTHREKMKGLSMTKDSLASSDERLARVEQAVESIALEIERIGEGQRYVTKLLNEPAQPLAAALAKPVGQAVTPH
ncbi:MAG: hypothetical protein JWL97_464 [Gemmatimonadales bacterium]|jgi:hypothetical protein|nr:hypothetical protein [Gemmatimonadales bacterium]